MLITSALPTCPGQEPPLVTPTSSSSASLKGAGGGSRLGFTSGAGAIICPIPGGVKGVKQQCCRRAAPCVTITLPTVCETPETPQGFRYIKKKAEEKKREQVVWAVRRDKKP